MRHVADTSAGQVEGREERGVLAFRGVPFAAPPTGLRRFRPPVPPEPWSGVRPCFEPGPACPQDSDRASRRYRAAERKDEDCLYLNIWTPALDDAARPVILFLHGGGYQSGSGAVPVYNGAAFARDGAVFVTCNYRLALFGFLYLDELFPGFQGSGNLGTLDQLHALTWLRENIGGFGGDPNNITVFGSSAGGVSIGALMAMPSARGLFDRAAPVSSSPGSARTVDAATRVTRRFLEEVGVVPGDTQALLDLPTERLILVPSSSSIPDRAPAASSPVSRLMDDLREAAGGGQPIGPVVDGTVLPRPPLDAVADGSAAGVDLLIGCSAEEMRGSLARLAQPAPDPDVSAVSSADPEHDIRRFFPASDRPLDEIRRVYARSLVASGRPTADADVFAAASSDQMIVRSIAFAAAHSRKHPNTYMFRFTWRSPAMDGLLGAFHGVATPFWFDNLFEDASWESILGQQPPRELATAMHQALISFASAGRPEAPGLPAWPAYEVERRATMTLDVPPGVEDDPESERRRLYEFS